MLSGDKISIIDKHIEDDDVFVSADTVNIDASVKVRQDLQILLM